MWAVSRNRQARGNAVSTTSGRKKVVLEKNLRKDVFIWLMVPADTVRHGRKSYGEEQEEAGHTAPTICHEGIIPGTQTNTFVSF